MRIFLASLFFVLAGCTSTQHVPEQVPTISFTCQGSCNLDYIDPRDRPRMPTNAYDVTMTLIETGGSVLLGTAPWLAVGSIATRGILNSGHNTNSTHTPTIVEQAPPAHIQHPPPVHIQHPPPIIIQSSDTP